MATNASSGEWTPEAVIGLGCMLIAVFALFIVFTAPRNPLIVPEVVQTRAADMLTRIPSQTPWVITATPTFTPTPSPTPIQKNHPR